MLQSKQPLDCGSLHAEEHMAVTCMCLPAAVMCKPGSRTAPKKQEHPVQRDHCGTVRVHSKQADRTAAA